MGMDESRKDPLSVKKKNVFAKIGQQGQSTMEYLMLLIVVAMIISSILKSAGFRSFFGPDAPMIEQYARYMEYSYRHGMPGLDDSRSNIAGNTHDTYSSGQNKSHFFIHKHGYE